MTSRLAGILGGLFFISVLGLVLWFGFPDAENTSQGDRIFVVTTIYPLADFIEQVGGDQVYVSNVVPAGSEPHDFEPSPREVAQVLEADLLVYVGAGFDDWAKNLAADTRSRGGVTLGVEDAVTLAKPDEDGEAVDPHAWLDPVLAQGIVLSIQDALVQIDPEREKYYAANAEAYVQALMGLDDNYAASLLRCELNDIIVSHDAFGYLARRYKFNVLPITGLSPEAEPSVRDLTRLANDARELGVKTIFFETLVSPELAETLAKEVGAETAVLNPLEGLSEEELAAGENYLLVMEKNRVALSSAMLCQ